MKFKKHFPSEFNSNSLRMLKELIGNKNNRGIVWKVFKDYINKTKNIGDVITRRELIDKLNKETNFNYSVETLDNERNMATQLGYLQKLEKRGTYKLLKYFEDDLTVYKLRKDYDSMYENKQL